LRASCGPGLLTGNVTAELEEVLLFAPQSDFSAGTHVEMLVRACKHTGTHEVGLQLQRVIEMKKKELHEPNAEPRESTIDQAE
jgi:hypothetical protein